MYCKHCGEEINDEAVICPKCGRIVNESKITALTQNEYNHHYNARKSTELKKAAKIFMVISCVLNLLVFIISFAISVSREDSFLIPFLTAIPFLWTLPMTKHYFDCVDCIDYEISFGFKLCTLLFVNQIAGILMLCDE